MIALDHIIVRALRLILIEYALQINIVKIIGDNIIKPLPHWKCLAKTVAFALVVFIVQAGHRRKTAFGDT